jgi:hypothetical protein
MWVRQDSDSSKRRLGKQARKNLPEPKTLRTRPTSTGGGMAQRVRYHVCINPHLGWLGDQVRTAPHRTDSKNLLEHCPSQRQELSRIGGNALEAPTDLYKLTISMLGPTGHVNLFLDVKIISLKLSDHLLIYKSPLPFRQEVRDHFHIHFVNFLSSLITPL